MSFNDAPKAAFGQRSLQSRAQDLVNPLTGLANDYLNHFNELVMIIEQLPAMPDLAGDLLAWRPVSYDDYFAVSPLPGRHAARKAYDQLDNTTRRKLEDLVAELDRLATGGVAAIRRHLKVDNHHDDLAAVCEKTSAGLRAILDRVSHLINVGTDQVSEQAQQRADRLLAVRLHAMRTEGSVLTRVRHARD
ncbi:MAG: uncharacterized protein JWL93_1446 [Hyphomicrobiales bacterium]|nr:uncharacterized protein [Hyphomicrobiales bacterium]